MTKKQTDTAIKLVDDKFNEFLKSGRATSMRVPFMAGVMAGLDAASMLGVSSPEEQQEKASEKTD